MEPSFLSCRPGTLKWNGYKESGDSMECSFRATLGAHVARPNAYILVFLLLLLLLFLIKVFIFSSKEWSDV